MILVVGPGRCGTSAMAGFIHKLGIKMVEQEGFKDESNPAGFYEDLAFIMLNDAMVYHKISTRRFIIGLRTLIQAKEEPWGLKQPAMAEFLPIYLSLLGDNVKVVRMIRNSNDVAQSMSRQYKWPIDKSMFLAKRREALLDYHLKDYPVLKVDFNDLRNRKVLEKVAKFVNKPLTEYAVAHIVTPEEIERMKEDVSKIRAELAPA